MFENYYKQLLVFVVLSAQASDAANMVTFKQLHGVALINNTNTSVIKTGSARQCAINCTVRDCVAAQYSQSDGKCTMTFGSELIAATSDTSKIVIVQCKSTFVS